MDGFRKEELKQFHRRSIFKGVMIFSIDAGFYLLAIAGALITKYWPLKLLFAVGAGLFTGLLFVVGHDACHQALTGSRRLNGLLGRLAFLPSMHPFSLWDLGHNRIHHRYTNQKGIDYVWEPLTPTEYSGLSTFRRLRYRFYRSLPGHVLYYLFEIWWRKMFFPRASEIGGYRSAYWLDLLLISLWLVVFPATLARSSFPAPTTMWADVLVYALLIPFLFFNLLMSFVIYLHHTHPVVKWFHPDEQGGAQAAQLRSALHVIFPWPVNWIFHRIMEHPAHHLRPAIPLYNLHAAQEALERRHSQDAIVYRWSLGTHLHILRRCKLFDVESGVWTDFKER